MRLQLTCLALAVLFAPTAASQCRGTSLGPSHAFLVAPAAAAAGRRLAVVTPTGTPTIDRVELRELQPDGSFPVVGVATGFDPILGFTRSMTFDGERIQFVGHGSGVPTLYELERDASGVWIRHDLQLTVPWLWHGELLSRDGDRFVVLGYRSSWCLALDVLERNGAGRLEVAASLDLETRFATGHDVVSGIALHGERIVLRSGAEQRGAGQVVERSASGQWRRTGFLVQPAGTSGYYNGALALQGDVCAVVRGSNNGFGPHVVHVYERDPAHPTGWSLRQEIPVPRAVFGLGSFRYIASVRLIGRRLIIGGTNRGVSQILERSPTGAVRFDPVTTIHGLGNYIVATESFLVGSSLGGEHIALTYAELAGESRVTVCIPAGTVDCVDPAHELHLGLWQRRIHSPHLVLVAELTGPFAATSAVLSGSPAFSTSVLASGTFCIGADPRRSVIPMVRTSATGFGVSVPLTALPVAGGTVSAIDGETWWFQASASDGTVRALSSAVRVTIRL